MNWFQVLALSVAIAFLPALHPASIAQTQPLENALRTPIVDADPHIAALNRRVADLRQAGKYKEALPIAREALALTVKRDGPDGLATARALSVLGELYFHLQNYAAAEPLLRRALEIRLSAGADESEITAARENLAKLHTAQEEFAALLLQSDALGSELLVISSTVPGLKVGTKLPHDATLDVEKGQVLHVRTWGTTYEIEGPYHGALDGYVNCSELEIITGECNGPRAEDRGATPGAAPRQSPPPRGPAPTTTRLATPYWDVVPIFYGTDREREPKHFSYRPKQISYSEQRAHRLELGRALVTVPKNHQVPEIERPWVLHIPYFDFTLYERAENPKEHFTLQEVKVLSRAEFLALVRERLVASKQFKEHAFVFIHGYNKSFEFALYRTAQIANDLRFDGVPFMYSWPSGGAVSNYGWDRESAEGARIYLRQFLDMVIQETGTKSISLIAHSMGNIALLDVLRDMNAAAPHGVVISQIILAAPDVSVDDFAELAKSIRGLASGVTLYASANDRALQISRGIWGSYRAGDVPPTGPVLAAGVDTIDVTAASTDVFALNHSGYAENIDLLNDVGALIEKGVRPPEARSEKIRPIASPKGEYWRYAP